MCMGTKKDNSLRIDGTHNTLNHSFQLRYKPSG